ncbi:MAG TPA: hypothetical protein VFF30_14150 [Nitrososphaerales archaeon]|nr:hypothetical protein [Nitrososphaerales archaeon]
MAGHLFGSGKFGWGVCIDDMWMYAGFAPPKSIIIPHFLNVELPEGPFTLRAAPKQSDHVAALTTPSEANDQEYGTEMLCKSLASQLKRCGINFVRGWFQWNLFQPRILRRKQQEYSFPLDPFVRELNNAGIRIAAVLGNGYFRFLPKGINIDRPADYVARLAEASREIVRHYRGKIDMWQLENEPNWWLEHLSTDWRRGGIWLEKDIAETILAELQRIVKEEDPKTETMINLEADTAHIFFKHYSKYCDVLGLDFYPNYLRSEPINVSEVSRIARKAKELVGTEILVAETGYPSGPRLFGYSEAKQVEYVKSVCEEAYSSDGVSGLGMWRLSDTYWLSFPFQENHFGLLNRQGSPKQAWFEYVKQIRGHP